MTDYYPGMQGDKIRLYNIMVNDMINRLDHGLSRYKDDTLLKRLTQYEQKLQGMMDFTKKIDTYRKDLHYPSITETLWCDFARAQALIKERRKKIQQKDID